MLGWPRKKFSRKEEEPEQTLLWGIVEGPFAAREIPDCGFPPDSTMLVLKVSRGEEVFDAEFWFDNFDEAYVLVKHFQTHLYPIVLNNKEP
jgi:hypothetical protein